MVILDDKSTRMQILIGEEQKKFLDQVANEEGKSVSALIREIVDQYRRELEEARLAEAARSLYALYQQDEELTAFTSLDAEEFA